VKPLEPTLRFPSALALCVLLALAACGGSDAPPPAAPAAPGVSSVVPAMGPDGGGTLVTVIGLHFDQGLSAVRFGGDAATNVTVLSFTTLTCVSPAGVGTVDVTVDTAGGSVTKGGAFTYVDPDAPAVASIHPAVGRPAGGGEVLLLGASFVAGATEVSFGAAAATGVMVQGSGVLVCTAPAGALGVVDVTVTTPNGVGSAPGAYTYANLPVLDVVGGGRDGTRGAFVFRDVLSSGLVLSADAFLDEATSQVAHPKGLDVDTDWLAVGSRDMDVVALFDGFATLGDLEVPDVVLNVSCRDLDLVGNDLYVGGANEVFVFRDVPTLSSGDPPDAVLSPGFCSISDIEVVDDVLYVSDRCASPGVRIWNAASGLLGGEPPDVELTVDDARRVRVIDDTLWVTQRGGAAGVPGFQPVGGLTSGMGPTALLPPSHVQTPAIVTSAGGRIFLGNSDYDDLELGLVAFDLAAPGTVLATVSQAAGLARVYDLQGSGNVLVGSESERSILFAYLDAAGVVSEQPPDVFLFDPRMNHPKPVLVTAP
jgi:hypothetical protein